MGRLIGTSVVLAIALIVSGCGSSGSGKAKPQTKVATKEYFPEKVYGVKASPRVSTAKRPGKGGGREMVGKPYRVRGNWYTPKEEPGYDKAGLASWYGSAFHGRLTANGEVYDMHHLSAAHPTFPLPSYARVTNKKNGHSVLVRVNDRGPFAHGRIIDLSGQAAELLDMKADGVAAVRVEYVGRAPTDGDDTPFLMASFRPNGAQGPANEIRPGVMLAMNGPTPSASLPGVSSGASFEAVQTASLIGQGSGAASAIGLAGIDVLPASFTLPTVGPIPPDRPSLLLRVAATTLSESFADIGLAYRGDRVTRPATAFAHLLGRTDGSR